MAISTFTIQFNEYELETISSALADYRDYAESDTDPILARCNAIDDKIDEAMSKAEYEFGTGAYDYSGMDAEYDVSEWRFECEELKTGGHL